MSEDDELEVEIATIAWDAPGRIWELSDERWGEEHPATVEGLKNKKEEVRRSIQELESQIDDLERKKKADELELGVLDELIKRCAEREADQRMKELSESTIVKRLGDDGPDE